MRSKEIQLEKFFSAQHRKYEDMAVSMILAPDANLAAADNTSSYYAFERKFLGVVMNLQPGMRYWNGGDGGGKGSPDGGHDAMDYANAFVGGAGTYFGLTGNMFHNEMYWVQMNGTLRSTKMLNNANQIYSTSYNVVKESLVTAKTWSNRMATLGLITTGIDIAVDGEVRPSHVINGIAAGVSYTGIGSLAAGAYYLTDIGFEIYSGYSLGERLDQCLKPQHGGGGSW